MEAREVVDMEVREVVDMEVREVVDMEVREVVDMEVREVKEVSIPGDVSFPFLKLTPSCFPFIIPRIKRMWRR
jgi:hypothetical protein